MKKFLTAIALTIAVPGLALAQSAPAPASKMACCEKMKAEGKDCKHMAKMDHGQHDTKAGADPHAGHDMSGAKTPSATAHKDH